MMIGCPSCLSTSSVKYGKASNGKQRFRCINEECSVNTFISEYNDGEHLGALIPKIMEQVEEGESVPDISRNLCIHREKVVLCVKELFEEELVIHKILEDISEDHHVSVALLEDLIDKQEIWKKKKADDSLLWHAMDHESGKVLAYVKASDKEYVETRVLELLTPYGIENILLEEKD